MSRKYIENLLRSMTSRSLRSCYDLFPGLEIFGFERQLISENEIVYRHVMTSEVFAFLSENFNSDEKEMQFQPMTHGDLWRCLPDELKVRSSMKPRFLKPWSMCDTGRPDSI